MEIMEDSLPGRSNPVPCFQVRKESLERPPGNHNGVLLFPPAFCILFFRPVLRIESSVKQKQPEYLLPAFVYTLPAGQTKLLLP